MASANLDPLSLAAFPAFDSQASPAPTAAAAPVLPHWMQLLFSPAPAHDDIDTDQASAKAITATAAPPDRIADAIVRTMLRAPRVAAQVDPSLPEFPLVPGKNIRSVGIDKAKTSVRSDETWTAPLSTAPLSTVPLPITAPPALPFVSYAPPLPSNALPAPVDTVPNVSSILIPAPPQEADDTPTKPGDSGRAIRETRATTITMRQTKPEGPPELDELVAGVSAPPAPNLSSHGKESPRSLPRLPQPPGRISQDIARPAMPIARAIANRPELSPTPSGEPKGELAFAAVLSLKESAGKEGAGADSQQEPTPKLLARPWADAKKLSSAADFAPSSSEDTATPPAPADSSSLISTTTAPAASVAPAAAPLTARNDVPAPAPTPRQAPTEPRYIAEHQNVYRPHIADSAPVRELAVRITPPGQLPVDVRVHQQHGETHVVVRAGEETTRAVLRQDLPRLVTALDRAGFHTETFAETDSRPAAFTKDSDTGGGTSHSTSRDASPSDYSRQTAGNSAGNQGQPEHRQQRHREQLHSYWMEQMEN